jgi:hypothetical protein
MSKFKPAKGKSKRAPAPKAGLPCVILILAGLVLIMVFLYVVLKSQGS